MIRLRNLLLLVFLLVTGYLLDHWIFCCREYASTPAVTIAAVKLCSGTAEAVAIAGTDRYLSFDRPGVHRHLAKQGWTLTEQLGDHYIYGRGVERLDSTIGQCSRMFVVWWLTD